MALAPSPLEPCTHVFEQKKRSRKPPSLTARDPKKTLFSFRPSSTGTAASGSAARGGGTGGVQGGVHTVGSSKETFSPLGRPGH